MIRKRVMGCEDLDSVVENELKSYEFPWTRGIFVDCIRADHECWVICDGEGVIGHGILSVAAGEAHLLNLCVMRTRQGEGHGRTLARHMLERARDRGAEAVFLEVRPSNVVAIALYSSMGFTEIGTRKNYYPAHLGHEDAMVLALALEPG